MSPSFPYKNVGIALLFTVLLGPLGLLYASFWGGILMIIAGFFILSSQFFYPILLFWLGCSIWAVAAVEKYNKKILRDITHKVD